MVAYNAMVDGMQGSGSGRLSLMIDLERCIGCKSCEVACKQEHGLGPGEYRNKVVWLGNETAPALDFLTVTSGVHDLDIDTASADYIGL